MTDITNISNMKADERREAARTLYRESAAAGYPLTGVDLGEHFGRGERWGRDRINEAKAEVRESSPGRLPGEVDLDGLPPVASTPPNEPETVPESSGGNAADATNAETAETAIERHFGNAETAETAIAAPAEPKPVRVWPVWLLMAPAAVAIWGGWVGLGEMAGFGPVNLLPGIAEIEVNTAITLPIGMEVYAAYALYVWLSGRAIGKAKAFARRSAITSLVVGALGQVAYHVMEAAGVGIAPWWITAAVACLPVAVLGMGAALAHMVKAEDE